VVLLRQLLEGINMEVLIDSAAFSLTAKAWNIGRDRTSMLPLMFDQSLWSQLWLLLLVVVCARMCVPLDPGLIRLIY
jgi:hypothetical protein